MIVGEGEDRERLEVKIHSSGLRNRCAWLASRKSLQVHGGGPGLDPSSLWEGFGNVIVEAMACGAPVVATDCPYGPAEIITDGVNGLLVPPKDVDALSSAIVRVLTDPPLRGRLSENGRARANDFDARTIAAAYGDVFLKVAGRGQCALSRGSA